MAMGHYKHGKTVFYRNLQHMDESDDKFEACLWHSRLGHDGFSSALLWRGV